MSAFWEGFEKQAISVKKEYRLMDEMSPAEKKKYESLIAAPKDRPLEGLRVGLWGGLRYKRSPAAKSFIKDFKKKSKAARK